TKRPDEVKMILVDPKKVELSQYKKIPHLMHPVVTDMKKAESILAWACDEMADLMMTAAKEVEQYIVRLAQLSRAVGMHLILATQKPVVDVVTGLIKGNMPARISFKVASRGDSRVILDENGADRPLAGDLCFRR